MTSDIEVANLDGVNTIRFARAAKKNALTGAMYQAIAEALSAGERDGAIAAHVFLGQPGVFTAGNDLADFVARAQSAVQSGSLVLDGPVMDVLRLLPRIEKPMIAAVDGIAIGIGTTLLMHCDLVYASPEARLQTPFLDLGLVPEAGSSLIGPRIMGHQRAFEMLVLGEPFSAERAREAGLVNAVVLSAQLEETAMAAARRLVAKPRQALIASRRLMRGDIAAVSAAIETEAQAFADRLMSPEAKSAFAAFFSRKN